MREDEFSRIFNLLYKVVVAAIVTVVLLVGFGWFAYENPEILKPAPKPEPVMAEAAPTEVSEGEFLEGEHKLLVIANCTGCHSGKLVTQNRATREGWRNMIRWMQETQNLKDLGADEEKILDYLSKNYAPADQGRRENLKVEEWYSLD